MSKRNGKSELGDCEWCGDGIPATETVGGDKLCAKCAADSREYDRKQLIRHLGVAAVCNEFWSWKSLPDEPKTMDDGEGGTFETWSKRSYLKALKDKFLGNPRYDQAVVKKYIASVEKKMEAK